VNLGAKAQTRNPNETSGAEEPNQEAAAKAKKNKKDAMKRAEAAVFLETSSAVSLV
jgi:hypothetical protein